ncbi:tRNA 4-thiouridine(8) synthase ThiI [Candidatus Bathyarchaeota archaeon]|nr:tRNA 4-thiouridine(8) synthase ThiI [Candidatus Bathyarchaeota archaeon]
MREEGIHNHKLQYDALILRFSGEIGIKSRPVRLRLEKRIEEIVKRELTREGIKVLGVSKFLGRLIINTPEPIAAIPRLTKVFGISSLSPALRTSSNLQDIVEASLRIAKGLLRPGSTFAVKCRRVGSHPYRSPEVCRRVGEAILNGIGRDVKVNLDEPDTSFSIEVRGADAYVYVENETIKGPGGFPKGSQGKVLCLLSGGVDSAVALWLAMKRGCYPLLVYFDNEPYTDDTTTQRAVEVAKKLSEWTQGFCNRVYLVPHGNNLKEILDRCPRRLTCILCKRMMYRIAEVLADRLGAEGLLTGEALGEQASQTLHNLRILEQAIVKYPVHRPLLGFDKDETHKIARLIGVYELTARKVKECTAAPEKPATKASIEDVLEAEERLDVDTMVRKTFEGIVVRRLDRDFSGT